MISCLVRKKRPRAKLVMLGISAGSGLVALFMGEQGERRRALQGREGGSSDTHANHHPDPECLSSFCDAAVGVCPGFNTETCMANFGPPYSWLMLYLQVK